MNGSGRGAGACLCLCVVVGRQLGGSLPRACGRGRQAKGGGEVRL